MTASTPVRLVLVAAAASAVLALLADSPNPAAAPSPGQSDLALHTSTIAGIRQGGSYYATVGEQLRQRGYPTASVFNWRTPLHYMLVAHAPTVSAAALMVLASLVLVGTFLEFRDRAWLVLIFGFIAQTGAVLGAFTAAGPPTSELWVGLLIAVSIMAYRNQSCSIGAGTGLAALFFRELAAPYCALAVVLGWRSRRRAELVIWGLGGLLYGGYLVAHVLSVRAHGLPGDLAQREAWAQLGGIGFILGTLRMNVWLQSAHSAMLAGWLALGLAGLAAPRASLHLKGAVVAYVGFLAAIGQPFNRYWGLVTAPLWAWAATWGLDACRALAVSHWPFSRLRLGSSS
jgi:hypothetical protein